MRTLILGLGNPILSDDRVGLEVARGVQMRLAGQPTIKVAEADRDGLALMESLVGYERVILIDAIQTGALPGSIKRLELDSLPTQRTAAAHGINLRTALQVGRMGGVPLPADEAISIVAIEAADVVTFSDAMTDDVAAAVPRAVQAVLSMLDSDPSE